MRSSREAREEHHEEALGTTDDMNSGKLNDRALHRRTNRGPNVTQERIEEVVPAVARTDAETKLEQQLATAQERADRAVEAARTKQARAQAIRSRLRVQQRKARTRMLIQIGAAFVRAARDAGGELTVGQAAFMAERLTTQKIATGETLMAGLVRLARKAAPSEPAAMAERLASSASKMTSPIAQARPKSGE